MQLILRNTYEVIICETNAPPPAGGQSVAEVDTVEGGGGWSPEFRAAGAVDGDDQTAAGYCGGSG